MESEKSDHKVLRACSETLLLSSNSTVKDLQSELFPVTPRKSHSAHSCFNEFHVKLREDEESIDKVTRWYLKYKESKEYKENNGLENEGQLPRWPTECQVLDERIKHIPYTISPPEPYYTPTGREIQPKPVGDEAGIVVYQYYPISAVDYFSRSSVGGSKYLLQTCPTPEEGGLRFESRFESGNLAKAIKISESYYELYLRNDMYTNRHMQWFYFRVTNMRKNFVYRFSLVNFTKPDSLYVEGMKPLMYSEKDALLHSIGWRRCGNNIAYFANDSGIGEENSDTPTYYTLTFTFDFPHEEDQVFFAHSYPYTYTDMQDYLLGLVSHPVKSTYTTLRLLCKSLAGNNVYYVTVTTPPHESNPNKKKKAIVITARVHPGETPSSWMMHGVLEYLTSDCGPAKELRDNFIFKLVPMLNPDGVIVGNYRCSLTGKDLNRQYRTVIREYYPTIWYTKLMIRKLLEDCGVAMYCDLHAHSRRHNIFIFGCENRKNVEKKLCEQVFPLMLHKNSPEKFSFQGCKFRVQKCKEGTGRVVMWMMGIANSFTMEASFGGTTLGSRKETHFNTMDFELMGKTFCQTLLDFYDEDPRKERLRLKIMTRLMREGSSADEPANINISDYSTDDGDDSTSTCSEHDAENGVPKPLPISLPPPNTPIKSNYKTMKRNKSQHLMQPAYSKPVQRRTLRVRKAELNFPIRTNSKEKFDSDDSSSTCSDMELKFSKKVKNRKKKPVKKKNARTKLGEIGHVTSHDYTIIDLEPEGRLHSKNAVCKKKPVPSQQHNKFLADLSYSTHNTSIKLQDVQTKLLSLKNKLWFGIGDMDPQNPLSWGLKRTNEISQVKKCNRKTSAKIKPKPMKEASKLLNDAKENLKDIIKSAKHTKHNVHHQNIAVDKPGQKTSKAVQRHMQTKKSISKVGSKKSPTYKVAKINFEPKLSKQLTHQISKKKKRKALKSAAKTALKKDKD